MGQVCSGVGQPPGWTYKSPNQRRLRSGRNHIDPGRGRCPVCNGCYAIRKSREGPYGAMVWHHHLDTVTQQVRRANARSNAYFRYRSLATQAQVEGATAINYVGWIDQSIDVVEEIPGVNYTSGIGWGHWQANDLSALDSINLLGTGTGSTFRVQLSSSTQNPWAQTWLFSINDQVFSYPTRQVTLATNSMVWNSWSQTITTGHLAELRQQTWSNWVTVGTNTTTNAYYPREARRYIAPQETPEERRIREEEAYQRVQIRNQAQREAITRAQSTLEELLATIAPDQIQAYRDRNEIRIRGSRGNMFRIRHGHSGNVDYLSEAGAVVGVLCAHPNMFDHQGLMLPHEDAMIAQLLHITTDEDDWLARANVHRGQRPQSFVRPLELA